MGLWPLSLAGQERTAGGGGVRRGDEGVKEDSWGGRGSETLL